MKRNINIHAILMIIGVMLLNDIITNAQGASHVDLKSAETIRPFRAHIPNEELKNLRKRILETRWPDKETVADQSQGAKLSKLQGLVNYWGKGYDWRKAEAKLNAYPQFVTTIDSVEIHFIHVRSKERNAMPLIISHGWPGSVFFAAVGVPQHLSIFPPPVCAAV